MRKIYLAGDHAGFKLKEKLHNYLKGKYRVEDFGPFKYDKQDDYPDFVFKMAQRVAKDKGSFGIVFAGSGIGEAIASNKVKGVRAICYYGKERRIVRTSRQDNDTNVLCIGARFLSESESLSTVKLFLGEKFNKKERHKRRLGKIQRFERRN
tara:strand:- start:1073 stop:1528 length:456 start_codon:yes stop_codon:yes gene_type:complete